LERTVEGRDFFVRLDSFLPKFRKSTSRRKDTYPQNLFLYFSFHHIAILRKYTHGKVTNGIVDLINFITFVWATTEKGGKKEKPTEKKIEEKHTPGKNVQRNQKRGAFALLSLSINY
jgi:hypothetical protein